MTMFWILTIPLCLVLGIVAYIDIKTYRLPDTFTFPLIVTGVLQSLFVQGAWISSLLGGIFGYVFFVGIEIMFKRITGRDGLGRGDAKLIAAAGTWLGLPAVPKVALCGSVLAIVFIISSRAVSGTRVEYLPFGPFLVISFITLWFLEFYPG